MSKRISRIGDLMPRIMRVLHQDEDGGVSIETILILAAISLPVLIFLVKFVVPRITKLIQDGIDDMTNDGAAAPAATDA